MKNCGQFIGKEKWQKQKMKKLEQKLAQTYVTLLENKNGKKISAMILDNLFFLFDIQK